MLRKLGVRGRLLMAFFGISAFAVLAAAAAMYSFLAVGDALDRITNERMPSALASLELSRQAERIVAAAPALLTVADTTQHEQQSLAVATEMERLEALLVDLDEVVEDDALAAIEPAVAGLRGNLTSLDDLIASRLEITERKERLLQDVFATHTATQKLLGPWVLVTESKLAELRQRADDTDAAAAAQAADLVELTAAATAKEQLQQAQLVASQINDILRQAAAAKAADRIPVLEFRVRQRLETLRGLAAELDPKLGELLLARVEEFRSFIEGGNGLPSAREKELELSAAGEALLAQNAELAGQLTDAVDGLVAAAKAEIDAANVEAYDVQRFSSGVLIAVVVLSLACSGLIVWLYVNRNLIARLTALSRGMLAVAGGSLRVPLPPADGEDEIAEMTRALTVFRDTAVEIEDKGLREIESARQRLVDAIESISEGFAFFDAEDRLALSNTRYQELLYGGTDVEIEPGMPFEGVIRRAVERGLIREAADDPERYVQERLAQHRNPGPPTLQERADGRWVLIAERRVTGGGTVAVYSDITELKRRELELEQANQRTQEAADEIERRHRELEALSSKLAKYLSPQVYASIFSGAQQVELASQRKKLTVFFSDLAGFTETTDVMESEDLTQLLNQYLTEMSRVALEHGGTIDKYVGDAIMIFFGDPESRGVKEDAVACVRMAIAMQKRMRELSSAWRDSGFERPLACRIGIHTGYCTVGNFGSEDRMDYTIIGGAVNLASRLEHEAPEGGILISYETYAHVKDEVSCEQMGSIQVRGIGHPVATYRVIDLYANLSDGAEPIRGTLPHLRLEAEPNDMSAEERAQALEMLRAAAERLSTYR